MRNIDRMYWVAIALIIMQANSVWAEEGSDAAAPEAAPVAGGVQSAPTDPTTPMSPATTPPKTRNPKGKLARDKEADGSEARDRFQADTVIKSKYELHGEPLEVDPD